MSKLSSEKEQFLRDRFDATESIITRVNHQRQFYLETIEWLKRQPDTRSADARIKRVVRQATKAQQAVRELLQELKEDDRTAALAFKRQAGLNSEQILRDAHSVLAELRGAVFPFPIKKGGTRRKWLRDNFIYRLHHLYQYQLKKDISLTMAEGIYETDFFDFILTCSEDLPDFGSGRKEMVALSSAIKRVHAQIELEKDPVYKRQKKIERMREVTERRREERS